MSNSHPPDHSPEALRGERSDDSPRDGAAPRGDGEPAPSTRRALLSRGFASPLAVAASSLAALHVLTGCDGAGEEDGASADGGGDGAGDDDGAADGADDAADDAAEEDGAGETGDPGGDDDDDAETGGDDDGEDTLPDCDFMVTTFPKIVDNEPTTSFTRMDQSALIDWLTIGASAGALMTEHVPAMIIDLLFQLDKMHVGYPVTLLEHSLQTATRAYRANARDDLVLAALCHDLGFAFTVEGHAEVSAGILRAYIDEDAYRVVRHHTEFEWMHYGSLIEQPTDQRSRYSGEAWFADAERLADEWDAASFEPGYDTMPLSEFTSLIQARFGDGSLANDETAQDCI